MAKFGLPLIPDLRVACGVRLTSMSRTGTRSTTPSWLWPSGSERKTLTARRNHWDVRPLPRAAVANMVWCSPACYRWIGRRWNNCGEPDGSRLMWRSSSNDEGTGSPVGRRGASRVRWRSGSLLRRDLRKHHGRPSPSSEETLKLTTPRAPARRLIGRTLINTSRKLALLRADGGLPFIPSRTTGAAVSAEAA